MTTEEAQFLECSKEMRESFGIFKTEAELDSYAFRSPFDVLKKFFGIELHADSDFMKRDQRIVEMRRRAWCGR